MDDPSSLRTAAEQARARAKESFSALANRADAVLTRQRVRIDDLETELSRQLDALSAMLNSSVADLSDRSAAQAELEELREQLGTSQQMWDQERAQLVEQLRQSEIQLEEQRALLDERQQELLARDQELQKLSVECEARQQQCELRERELAERHAQIESNDQINVTRTVQIDGREIELNLREHQLTQKEKELAEHQKRCDHLQEELTRKEKELEQTERQVRQREDSVSHADEKTNKRIAELEKQLAAANEHAKSQQSELQASFAHLEKGFAERQEMLDDEIRTLRQERDQLVEALNATSARLETAEAAVEERDELRHKFGLALADVQRLRERTSELEQELARRPEPQAGESAELVHLRAERDALAEQMDVLKKQLAEQCDDVSDQEMADLRRRFEMAVEDVRALKNENAALQKKVAAAATSAVPSSDSGGQDWEAQKRRLLAALSAEGEDTEDEERAEERVRIEDTIRITDELIAEKDREITEMQAQLVSRDTGPSAADEKLEELLSGDDVIRDHRARVAELEKELVDKLRTAELELSVQRAKIAREQTELAEWRTELEALRNSLNLGGGGSAGGGPPKRRWLAKLGLGEDED
jgi:chromosome segregation ATPase